MTVIGSVLQNVVVSLKRKTTPTVYWAEASEQRAKVKHHVLVDSDIGMGIEYSKLLKVCTYILLKILNLVFRNGSHIGQTNSRHEKHEVFKHFEFAIFLR